MKPENLAHRREAGLLKQVMVSKASQGRRGSAGLVCSRWLAAIALFSPRALLAQETIYPPPEAVLAEGLPRYNIPWGRGGLNLSAGLRGVYVDNVFLTQTGARNDFVLVPEGNIAGFFPVGLSNTVVLDVGIAYYQYFKNTSLNTGTPVINPNSELAFNLQVKDFRFRFSEHFSYQQSPVYETGGEFFNLYNTGLFERFENRVGVLGTWDLQNLVLNAGYSHENLWANTSHYEYIDHASELFSADGMLVLSPVVKAGLEAAGSMNNFDNNSTNNCWRARVGPALRLDLSRFIQARLGAGYERIEYNSAEASALGLRPENTYYAYAGVHHDINRFFSHSAQVYHDNQLAYSAGNLAGTHLQYYLTWRPNESLSVSPHGEAIFYDESYGSGPSSLYHERFTYVLAGITLRYEWGQHWRARLSWDYRLKDSEVEVFGYAQNQAALEVIYQF